MDTKSSADTSAQTPPPPPTAPAQVAPVVPEQAEARRYVRHTMPGGFFGSGT